MFDKQYIYTFGSNLQLVLDLFSNMKVLVIQHNFLFH